MRGASTPEQPAEHGIVVGAKTTAEVLDPARRLAQDGHGRLHSHRPKSGSSTSTKVPRAARWGSAKSWLAS